MTKADLLESIRGMHPKSKARKSWSKMRLVKALEDARARHAATRLKEERLTQDAEQRDRDAAIRTAFPLHCIEPAQAGGLAIRTTIQFLNRIRYDLEGAMADYQTLRALISRYVALRDAAGTAVGQGVVVSEADVAYALGMVCRFPHMQRHVDNLVDHNTEAFERWGEVQDRLAKGLTPPSLLL